MSHETEDDPGEELSVAIAEKLNSLPLSLVFTAEHPDDLTEANKLERPELTVLVGPFDEEAEHIDRCATAMETFQTSVVVIRKLSDEFTRPRLSRFTRELKLALRGVHFVLGSGGKFYWIGDITAVKFDPEKIRIMKQFHSVIRVQHRGIV